MGAVSTTCALIRPPLESDACVRLRLAAASPPPELACSICTPPSLLSQPCSGVPLHFAKHPLGAQRSGECLGAVSTTCLYGVRRLRPDFAQTPPATRYGPSTTTRPNRSPLASSYSPTAICSPPAHGTWCVSAI